MSETKTPAAFEYLLNAMESASQSSSPAYNGYGDKRKAVLAHVAAVESDLADARAALRELLERHVQLVACGDCGNWDVETEREVIAARAVLAKG